MPVQIVPTHEHGDVRYEFDTKDESAVKIAMERFRDLVKNQKRTAVALGDNGEGSRLLREFDPTVERAIFLPARQGG